jgi:uncharacterized membrane protein YsdA (DUF1294 family)
MIPFAIAYLILVVVMSLTAFVVYGIDKRRAGTTNRRIPENTLHLIAFLCGWPGAWLAQRQFRHKTRKLSFQIVFWIVIALHLVAVTATGWSIAQSR